VVFALNTDGTGFTNLHSFTALSVPLLELTAMELIRLPIWFIGQHTVWGGAGGRQRRQRPVFALNTAGTGLTNLYTFTATSTNSSGAYTNSDGANPSAGLILSATRSMERRWTAAVRAAARFSPSTPMARVLGTCIVLRRALFLLLLPTATEQIRRPIWFYRETLCTGTAAYGGASGNGTVFAVHIDGTGFTDLHIFAGGSDGAGLLAN